MSTRQGLGSRLSLLFVPGDGERRLARALRVPVRPREATETVA